MFSLLYVNKQSPVIIDDSKLVVVSNDYPAIAGIYEKRDVQEDIWYLEDDIPGTTHIEFNDSIQKWVLDWGYTEGWYVTSAEKPWLGTWEAVCENPDDPEHILGTTITVSLKDN